MWPTRVRSTSSERSLRGSAAAERRLASRPARLAACGVTMVVFTLYRATLLPGFDFGDTASLQTVVGSSLVTPRNGYPLYFALGAAFVWLTNLDPAYALKLASAVFGAVGCGLLVLLAGELSGSVLAGTGSALLFAGSYTFWSQSVIAEVYALHMTFVLVTLWLLLRWEHRPSLVRLGGFFAVYALGFGNHLSMILLAPGYALFLLTASPQGWRVIRSPAAIGLAILLAAAGASQYAWNLHTLLSAAFPPATWADALRTAWFDITKSDWRDTMVLHVPAEMLSDRAAMYAFDLRQQFGLIGPALAVIGCFRLFAKNW